ncbi:MAG TPA: acyl carrier protein [Holophagaceae bacterium]|nr:acyl carrier protein [Holophagaceae bacterium]
MHQKEIRDIILNHARLSADVGTLADTSDLYAAGLTSLTTVNLMLALEDHFDIEFPDRMLVRKTFESIQSLSEAVEALKN